MLTKSSQAYKQITVARYQLLQGTVVSIDPSVGSTSSMPGYAVYQSGILQASGTLTIPPTEPLHRRLQILTHQLRKLYRDWSPDVLVYEEIPVQAYGNRHAGSHASLLKAVGATLAVSGPDHYVGLQPISWKKMVRDTYEKGDEADAIEMGWIAIWVAGKMEPEEHRPYGGRKGRRERTRSAD